MPPLPPEECAQCGATIPRHARACPECGAETEVYSRVVGYLRPVKQWNKGKQAEFGIRNTYCVEETAEQAR